ncbi:hypothetical protein Tco_1264478 [Tanacetum coccineum]
MDHLWKFLGGKRDGDNRIVNKNDHNVMNDGLNVGSSVNISSSSGVKTSNGLMSDGLNVGSPDEIEIPIEETRNKMAGMDFVSSSLLSLSVGWASKESWSMVKLHGVLVLAFIADGLSVIASRLGTISTASLDVGSWDDRALSDNVVVFVPRLDGNGFMMHTVKVLGDLEDDGFTSPNHFDLLTKEDGKTILLNLHESDDDADVENSCDDTATPSRSVGNSPSGNT